ncbi:MULTISPECIES: DUF47 domain-containing protein [unclassified Adlercreutzia]|uniref:DUF47 domain-containing protein n=1 Tax=unclassified Adlercreutzia TaxID=2636013 RepID=UPI0013EAAA09|nr:MULTISPECIES: DUF47 family protein [unclassified Adlercreutzia]
MAKVKLNYFKAYEKLTGLAVEEADLLIEAMRSFTDASGYSDTMVEMHEFENRGDSINHDIFTAAAIDFMPPFDREDVVNLAQALDNVLDYIDDVLGHMYVYDIRTMPEDALQFAELIKKSVKALDRMMAEFHTFKKNKKFKQLVVDINSYEEEADALYKQAMRRLHVEDNEAVMHVLVWSRIYERMERCCDATEHAADIVSTIMLKN